MLDRFIYGHVSRISPEAPIPILNIENEIEMLGGAGNVVRNLSSLGAHCRFISVTGTDDAGKKINALLDAEPRVEACLKQEAGRRTIIKTRFIANTQQVLRADWDYLQATKEPIRVTIQREMEDALTDHSVVVLSDYGKGVLDDGSLKHIIQLARQAGTTVLIDPKGRDYSRYAEAGLLTPNLNELRAATGKPLETEGDILESGKVLIDELSLDALLVTRSKEGMTLLTRNGDVDHFPALARDVFDVSGAGDTVVATLAAGLSAGGSLKDAVALANLAAGIVVGKVGTAIVYKDDLEAEIDRQQVMGPGVGKVLSREQLQDQVNTWRRQGFNIGFTNGCFDLLHPGHISLLDQAAAQCDRLVVGLNNNASVKRLKGDARPVQDETARSAVLAALAAVDAVTLFEEDTPIDLITAIQPDLLVKGADYRKEEVIGQDIVEARGGRVFLARLLEGHSTTATVGKLKQD